MNEIMNIKGIECYEKDGTVYLKLETVARGLGFTQTQNKNGVEYTSIRWETVGRYLEEFGFPNKLGKETFIPENIFYRLAMKAKNETAEKFQALVADEIIPSIRKTGSYGLPMTTGEQIQLLAKGNVELNQRVDKVEDKITSLENDMPLYGSEIDELQKHVRRKGVTVLGGKQSGAYKDSSIRGQVYSDIYSQLKREYGCVSSYKSIKRKYIADAHDFIDCYEVPKVLEERIETANVHEGVTI